MTFDEVTLTEHAPRIATPPPFAADVLLKKVVAPLTESVESVGFKTKSKTGDITAPPSPSVASFDKKSVSPDQPTEDPFNRKMAPPPIAPFSLNSVDPLQETLDLPTNSAPPSKPPEDPRNLVISPSQDTRDPRKAHMAPPPDDWTLTRPT